MANPDAYVVCVCACCGSSASAIYVHTTTAEYARFCSETCAHTGKRNSPEWAPLSAAEQRQEQAMAARIAARFQPLADIASSDS